VERVRWKEKGALRMARNVTVGKVLSSGVHVGQVHGVPRLEQVALVVDSPSHLHRLPSAK
jgi:hypothetical protein